MIDNVTISGVYIGRVDQTVSNKGDGSWSWVNSNFHPDDPLDFSYTDPSHRAVYGLSQLDDTIRLVKYKDNN